jgi:hypothetical protein
MELMMAAGPFNNQALSVAEYPRLRLGQFAGQPLLHLRQNSQLEFCGRFFWIFGRSGQDRGLDPVRRRAG